MEAKEEIRSRLNIEDVIGQYVQLKRAGRNFKGLSPFSQEKTPSFMVSPDKSIWHDFSSGKGGDVFTFVMEVEGLDFKGALELLARKAGVDLSQYQTTGDGSMAKKKERLYQACDLAAKYYQQCLLASPLALNYVFKKRGFDKQVVRDFRLGYAPDSQDGLIKALMKRGFTPKELADCGLLVQRRNGPGDMFRARMVVALTDIQNRVVGFTARYITEQPNAPKYINTPQTLLYDKGRQMFGLAQAKEAIRQAGFAVVVEGNPDVISSHQVGIKNVVATAGTAMTEYHLRTLGRFCPDVRLGFDADKAGVNATERAIAIASNLGISLKVVTLPEGAKDPDELIKRDPQLWRQAIDSPHDAVDWLLDVYSRRYDLTTAEGKRQVTDQALGVVRPIADPVVQEHYLKKINQRAGISVAALNAKLNQSTKAPGPRLRQPKNPIVEPDHAQYQDHLLALAAGYSQIRDLVNDLEPAYMAGDTRQKLLAELKRDRAPVLQSDDLRVKIAELELIREAKYPQFKDDLYYVAAGIAKRIKKEYKQRERLELVRRFTASEQEGERQSLSDAIKQLDKDIEALKH